MKGFRHAAPLVAAVLAMTGCDTSSVGEAGISSDLELAAQLYAGTPRAPAAFLSDPVPSSFLQVATYHLKSTQVDPAANLTHEVCTDDWTEALAWSELMAEQAPSYLDLVGNEQTARYYELDRVASAEPERYVRMRVYRCDYLDRVGVDLAGTSDFAGIFNHRPIDATALGELSEYLWHFSTYNNAGHAVLQSAPRAAEPDLAHVITIASLERATTAESCDRVILREWRHAVDPVTGALRATTSTLREIAVRRESGTVVAC